MTKEKKLVEYICAAAFQRQLMEPWLMDKRFAEENGGKVYYAVDADIIKLYTAPEEISVAKGDREGYAHIFPDDDENLSVAIGRALAEHIFHRLTEEGQPLFVIPPIEEEIRDVYTGVARNAEREEEQAYSELRDLRNSIDNLKKESDKEKIVDELRKRAASIFRLLAGEGYTAEFSRFNRLLTKTRIAAPEFAIEQGWVKDENVRQALATLQDLAAWFRISKLQDAWFDLLRKLYSDTRKRELIDNDALALARLEWINSNLDTKKYRLVYITGAQNIYKASKKYYPIEGEPSFADMYLRHPRAYLAERHVLSPDMERGKESEGGETEFLKWLDTFLGDIHTGWKDDMKALDKMLEKTIHDLESVAKKVLDTHPEIISKFEKSWTTYTQNLILSYGTPEYDQITTKKSGLMKQLQKLSDNTKYLLDYVDEQIKKRLRESWDACFEAATKAGYGLLFYKVTRADYHASYVPPLLFNSLPKTQDFVHRILAARERRFLKSAEYRDAIGKLMDEDNSGYSYYLAYALLFAAEGSWNVSAILSARAIDIAKTLKVPTISGREATYLRAVALRHNTRHMNDLAKLLSLLDDAHKCLEQDRILRPGLPGGEVRFDAERLAIYASYNMFRLLLDEKPPKEIPNLAQLQEMVEGLLNKLESVNENKWMVRNVERNLLIILLTVVLLRWGKEKENIEPALMRPYFEHLITNIESKDRPTIERTFRLDAVYSIAGWWTTPDHNEKKNFRQVLIRLLTDYNIKINSVFPYDKKLFEFFREIVASRT